MRLYSGNDLMKKALFIIGLIISVCASAQISKVIPARPSPPRLVNDFSGLLTPEQRDALERKLVAYDDSTSNQVTVVILKTLEGYDANEFSTALGRAWGVGGKEFNNGIVVLITTGQGEGENDAYIAVGYGLEGAIPDMTAGYILDHELIPNLKAGNAYRGFVETADAIAKAAEGEYTAPKNYRKGKPGIGKIQSIVLIMIILFLLFAGRGGGGTYASRGGYRGWRGGGWLGGGGWSGGGGSSGGGGFGGFGGGSFGGGGAGGKW